jgi:hypothetical protein
VCPPLGYELALSQAQRSRGLARIGHDVSEEACARVVFVEDVRGAEVLCVSGCVGVACEAAGLVIFAPKIVRKVRRVVGCDGLPNRRGVK